MCPNHGLGEGVDGVGAIERHDDPPVVITVALDEGVGRVLLLLVPVGAGRRHVGEARVVLFPPAPPPPRGFVPRGRVASRREMSNGICGICIDIPE